ncbi:acyltransferase family protein [Sphingosinicella sp. BN140058]|uniref:acyltransferase family protein n=1 Tax=Sphingosinicella sp. BN140058 TaxID=1892855 RepID=UPI0013EC5C0D|nr:acyltransferase family protein [Sphingosinicella sp. BN140058]
MILFHLRPRFFPGGYLGVDIFFVISGFVVTRSFIDAQSGRLRTTLARFYARRVVRIVPALVVMLTVTSVFSVLFIPAASVMTASRGVAVGAAVGGANIVLAFLSQAYFGGSSERNPFLHTWTLGVEEQFYLVLPFLIWLWSGGDQKQGRRRLALSIGALGFASLLLSTHLYASAPNLAFYLMPSRFWELAAGVLLAIGLPGWQEAAKSAGLPARWCAYLFSIAMLGALITLPWLQAAPRITIGAVVAAMILLMLVVARPGYMPPIWLETKAATYVGRASYSLYLWHWPVIVLLRWTIGLEGGIPLVIALVLTAVLGLLSYHFVEQPFRAKRRETYTFPLQVVLAGSVALLVCACVVFTVFHAERSITLSRMHYGLLADRTFRAGACASSSLVEPLAGGTVERWSPRCPGKPGRARLFVVGDSYAWSYGSMAARYAAGRGAPAAIFHRNGCPFPYIAPIAPQQAGCEAFHRSVIATLSRSVAPGDVVVMASLRIDRLDPDRPRGIIPLPARPAAAAMSRRRALALLLPLARRGAILVFEAPRPVFRAMPYRCSDWFNRANPDCRGGFRVPEREFSASRAVMLAEYRELGAVLPRAAVWDPFPALCPASVCDAYRGDRPLYFDSYHVTEHANDLLYPAFLTFIDELGHPPSETNGR